MRQWAASYSENGDAMGRPSWRSSFLGDAGTNFFCTGPDVLEILPHPGLRFAPKRVTLRATQGFAPTGVRELIHQEVGPNEKIKRGQIKLTEPRIRRGQKPSAGTRWLAVPRLRCRAELAGSSPHAQEPTWRRCGAQSDYTLRQLSRKTSRREGS